MAVASITAAIESATPGAAWRMIASVPGRVGEPARERRWLAALVAILVIASLYLPMLSARFDFADDGNLVYPAPPMALAERARLTWGKVVANYEHLGPFRPVVWAHWDLQAELLGADALRWWIWRLGWMALAGAMFLWLLRELRIASGAAVVVTALAMWSAPPNEIWRSLTLSEGVAMPYALAALVCAVRAGRSPRAWPWDVAGAACAVAALGCKNTFAAIVPAQLLLRVAPDGGALAAAVRRHGARAAMLALPLLLPVAHYVVFARGWHAGQYEPGPPSWQQLRAMVDRVQAGVSLGFIAPGLVLAIATLATTGQAAAATPNDLVGWLRALRDAMKRVWRRHRAAGRAGLALLLCGIGIYLPLRMADGRYAIPAVWGVHLCIAALLSEVESLGAPGWKRLTFAVLAVGLAAVAAENLLRQDKLIARSSMLWEALEVVEQQAGHGAGLAWQSSPGGLGVGEGVHFYWHLAARGRGDLRMQLLDASGRVEQRREIPVSTVAPSFLLASPEQTPSGGPWSLQRRFAKSYRWGLRQQECVLWVVRPTGDALSEGSGVAR